MPFMQGPRSGRIVVAVTIAASIATIVVFGLMQRPEGTMAEAGYGIIPYEFVFTADRAQVILDAWSTEGRDAARRSILIDFAFVPSYALLFGSVAVLAVRRLDQPKRSRWVLPLLPLVAGVCDVVENGLLLRMLGPAGASDGAAMAAGVFASVKFGLLAVTLLGCTAAGLGWFIRRG